MYFTVTSLFIISQFVVWFYYQDIFLVRAYFKRKNPEFSPVNLSLSRLDNEENDFPKNHINIGKEPESLDYQSHNLNYSLRTLEFITFLENKLGSSLSSKSLSADNLAELLEIKVKVQQNILESTDKYLKK